MTTLMAFVVSIILIALIFDYINGFHDAANSIATVVSTRVLSPGLAVMWAAFFNFAAFAIFGTRVAKTIGGDLIHIDLMSNGGFGLWYAGLVSAMRGTLSPDTACRQLTTLWLAVMPERRSPPSGHRRIVHRRAG
jgi:phosphate/sulfate permease